MVYRNGGIIKKCEKWWLYGKRVETCSYYKYLGLLMSTRGSWSMATKTLGQQASKAMYIINKLMKKGNIPFDVACQLFDKMIVPILVYAAEIWGCNSYEYIERIHRKFLRQQLGVSSSTSNIVVYGETGRYPLSVIYLVKCVKYWLKLVEMDNNRYPKACYKMLYNLDENNRQTWVSFVKETLYKYGFMYAWLQQGVGDKTRFIYEFKQRLIDMWKQEWHAGLDTPKLSTYKLFKLESCQEKYLTCVRYRRHLVALAKFRCSNHKLLIEEGRRQNVPRQNRLCQFCLTQNEVFIEDEYHVLFVCKLYDDIRRTFIDKAYYASPSLHTLAQLLGSNSTYTLNELAVFIHNMFKLRET